MQSPVAVLVVLVRDDGCPPKKRASPTKATLADARWFRRGRSVPCSSGRIGQFAFKVTDYLARFDRIPGGAGVSPVAFACVPSMFDSSGVKVPYPT